MLIDTHLVKELIYANEITEGETPELKKLKEALCFLEYIVESTGLAVESIMQYMQEKGMITTEGRINIPSKEENHES